jgi:hypothetical protein
VEFAASAFAKVVADLQQRFAWFLVAASNSEGGGRGAKAFVGSRQMATAGVFELDLAMEVPRSRDGDAGTAGCGCDCDSVEDRGRDKTGEAEVFVKSQALFEFFVAAMSADSGMDQSALWCLTLALKRTTSSRMR